MSAEAGAAAGTALIKYIGLPVIVGAIAAALGFLILPPKTHKEFVARLVVTIICSALFGPWLYFWAASTGIGSAVTALAVSEMTELAPAYVKMMLSTPCLVLGGLPGWWLLGALVRWLDKRKDKDIGELYTDAKKDFLS